MHLFKILMFASAALAAYEFNCDSGECILECSGDDCDDNNDNDNSNSMQTAQGDGIQTANKDKNKK